MKKLMITSAVGLMTALTLQAEAQTGSEACAQSWTAVDADKNGKISKSEAQKATELEFTRVDMDGNGTISVKEWKDCAAPGAIPGGFQADTGQTEEQLKDEFSRMDVDKSGDVSLKESAEATTQSLGGQADEEPARKAGALFSMLDIDGDGKLTWGEWITRDQADTEARFNAIDKDANNEISRSEWQEHRARGFDQAQSEAGGEPGLVIFYHRFF